MDRRFTTAAVALLGAVALWLTTRTLAQEPAGPDEQALKAAGMKVDTPALLRLLEQRTLQDAERATLAKLIRALDSELYEDRQLASDELLKRGPVALPLIKAVLQANPPAEVRRRAEDLARKLEVSANRETIVAAARLLAERRAPGAIEVLLRYLPNADDAWLEEEVLTSLGRLAIHQGEPDARLLATLHDPLALRRGAVLYLLGRRGNVAQRTLVRAHLNDADPLVRARALDGLVGKQALQTQADTGPADEAALKSGGIAPTETALLDFLHKRTPDTAEQTRLAGLVGQLGSLEYADRYFAAEALIRAGTASLPFLRPATLAHDAEVARRARRCIEEIVNGPGPALPTAVVRRLAWPGMVKDVPAALHALIDFIPFAEDEAVEEEVRRALVLLSARQPKVDPVLPPALDDPLPSRRAAAAYALGCTATEEYMAPVRKLLGDPVPAVRLRAAQGLLAAKDRTAVPTLIALLGELPPAGAGPVEEALNRLAGEQPPAGATTAASRPKVVAAWQQWWQERQGTLDLARAAEGESYLGLATVCEYDSGAPGRFSGLVWEGPRDGAARFRIANLTGPMDAQMLPSGRVLVAENGANRVTERDRDGNVKWEYTVQGGNPICCQRLPNGNTFIALYNQLLEVRPDKSEVYRFMPGPQFYIFSARKTRTGTIVCITAQGSILEVEPLQQKTLHTINLGPPVGGWAGIEPLPNGNYLIATMNNNALREIDRKGATVWNITSPIPGVFRATRLPNGNHLVVSMSTREVAELDRNGAVRWRHACQGRPWSVHYR